MKKNTRFYIVNMFCLFVGLIAFAVIFTSCPSSISGSNSTTPTTTKSVKVTFNGWDDKDLSKILNFDNDKVSVNDKTFTFKKIPLDGVVYGFSKLGLSYKDTGDYVINTITINGNKIVVSVDGKFYKKFPCKENKTSITFDKDCSVTIDLIDKKLANCRVKINGTKITTSVGSEFESKNLLDKKYLGFNLSNGKLKWIIQPDNSPSYDYLSNSEVAFGWNTGFSSIKEGLEKKWMLAKTNFDKTREPYFLNPFHTTAGICDNSDIKFEYSILKYYYYLKVTKDLSTPSNNNYYVYYYSAVGYDMFFNWVVVAIPNKEDSVLPSYVIQVKPKYIKDASGNNTSELDTTHFTCINGNENYKVQLSDLLGISNDSVNVLMNSDNYDTYAIILNVDGREEEEYIFSGWSWYEFRNVIKINDSKLQW